MTISPEVEKAAAIVCQETGQEPSKEVLICAECLSRLMQKLKDKGRRHAREGCRPGDRSQLEDLFPFIEWEDLRNECIDLLYDSYMKGYNSVKEGNR